MSDYDCELPDFYSETIRKAIRVSAKRLARFGAMMAETFKQAIRF